MAERITNIKRMQKSEEELKTREFVEVTDAILPIKIAS